jgi:hypothetical protein
VLNEGQAMVRARLLVMIGASLGLPAHAQEIVKVPATLQPSVKRPDDLFQLSPGTWHFARHLWESQEPCDDKSCEAGFTSGDLVVSVERSDKFVRAIAGLRDCASVGFNEVETGSKPDKYARKRVANLVDDVVKAVGKTCKRSAPKPVRLDVSAMFPATAKK